LATPILVGAVAGAFGVKGLVKLKTFTADPWAICAYGPLNSEDGSRQFDVRMAQKPKGDLAFVQLSGITNRDQAEALKGLRLYVDRARLPPPDPDDFYLIDLIGLRVEDTKGVDLGRIKQVHNHGAGDVLEVTSPEGPVRLYAFTTEIVPIVDIAGGKVVVDPPGEVEVGPEAGELPEGIEPDLPS
jgi:16S rRNA processing protein RimM